MVSVNPALQGSAGVSQFLPGRFLERCTQLPFPRRQPGQWQDVELTEAQLIPTMIQPGVTISQASARDSQPVNRPDANPLTRYHIRRSARSLR
jgi:hypothetical protein